MKKIIALLIVFCMLIPSAVFAENNITVEINGEKIIFNDQQPVIVDGRTLVPFRAIAESLGCMVEWADEEKTVYIACGKIGVLRIIGLPIGSTNISITDYSQSSEGVENTDSSFATDVPASIINNRTMVPLRVITDLFGGTVLWDDSTKTASIDMDVSSNVVATDDQVKAFMNSTFMKAKHILILSGETRSDDEAKKLSEEILARINSGEDFDVLMAEYSEDPGSKEYPEGYVFTYGEMVPEFEQAVQALQINQISATPVKSSYGYHIIKREDFTEEEYAAGMDAFRFIVLASLVGLDIQ